MVIELRPGLESRIFQSINESETRISGPQGVSSPRGPSLILVTEGKSTAPMTRMSLCQLGQSD